MDGWKPLGPWRTGAAAAGVLAVILVAIQLMGWPNPSGSHSPSPLPSDDVQVIVPDVPVLIDAQDAKALVDAFVGVPGSAARVDGPINLPAGAGPHWVVTLADGTRLLVGLLLGNVARVDVTAEALQPKPISPDRLTIEEARALAFASVGELVPSPDSNASMDLNLIPGRAFWCGDVHQSPLGGRLSVCVDLVEKQVYSRAQIDALVAAKREYIDAVWNARAAFERATGAYRLVRALGPADRLLGIPVSAPDLNGLAAAAGLQTVMSPDGPAILGPWREVLALLAGLPPTDIVLEEDRAALRPVPAGVGRGPHPGAAYAGWPADGRVEVAGNLEMPPQAIAEALNAIARSLRPADGRPYDRLWALTLCDSVRTCSVTVFGDLLGAGEDRNDFQVNAGDPIRLFRTTYEAVPRPMVQEAERIARGDPATAALIGSYETLASVSWTPVSPNRLVLSYERTPPGKAVAPGGAVAATAVLVDRLIVNVDLLAGRVISTQEEPAEVPTARAPQPPRAG